MDERIARLERTLAELSQAVAAVERRLAALESGAREQAPSPAASVVSSGLTDQSASEDFSILSLVGRTLVVLGGGYLLRWITDSGTLPRTVGTAFGLAYAFVWIVTAWRAAGIRRRASADFHCVAAVLIAFPLLWEATIRFHLFSQASAAVALTLMSAVGLAVAWHRRIQSFAWIVTSAGLLCALALLAAGMSSVPLGVKEPALGLLGHSAAPMALYLTVLGVVTLWLGYTLDWVFLRWPVAFVADFTVLVMIAGATEVWPREQPGAVMIVQLVMFAGYLVSFIARTLWRSRDVVPFEVLQTLALIGVAFGGAVYLMVTTGSSPTALGVVSLVFGAASYAAAFAFVDWRRGHWKNFVFYASLGVGFAIVGTTLTAAPTVQVVALTLAGVACACAGKRYASITLSSHATIYIVTAAVVSGLLGHATDALTTSAAASWRPLMLPALVTLGGAAIAAAMPLCSENESWGRCSRLPKIALVVVLLWSVGGAVSGGVAPLLAGQPGTPVADAAAVASIRTVILGFSVLLLAWASRGLFVEGRWLMYVVLVAGGLKLLIEDLPNGRPATLFLTFAVYGGALILGPRLLGKAKAAAPAPPPSAAAPF